MLLLKICGYCCLRVNQIVQCSFVWYLTKNLLIPRVPHLKTGLFRKHKRPFWAVLHRRKKWLSYNGIGINNSWLLYIGIGSKNSVRFALDWGTNSKVKMLWRTVRCMDVIMHSSSFLLPKRHQPVNKPVQNYALVVLNQQLPRFMPRLWDHGN